MLGNVSFFIYFVLSSLFSAALLLCDYGMFSTPSPSPSEMSTTAISDTSGPNTTATTEESIRDGNDSSSLEFSSGNDQFNYSTTDIPYTTKTSEGYSGINNESVIGVTSSTARAQPKEDPKQKGWRIFNDLLGGYG